MPIEYEILPFFDWLLPSPGERFGALLQFAASFAILGLIGLLAWYVVAAIRLGPSEGFYAVAKVVYNAFADDLPHFSLRRTYAMTRLAVQEAIRNRVIVVFIVFVVFLLFAGWFLDANNPNPGRLYLGYVLTLVKFLLLVLALFLSVFSIPTDIKNRTVYTIVTKPVRAGEIILGRILGFTAIGTALLVLMCVTSYFFVLRGLAHSHDIDPAEMVRTGSVNSPAAKGRTSFDAHHRHEEVLIGEDGTGRTDTQMGHWHPVTVEGDGDNRRYVLGPHQGMLMVRVPVYGNLQFMDRSGNRGNRRGVSTGDEWTYRSYIEGKTQATAIWTFSGVTEERFPDGLPLEINLGVFRTHKGDIERTVLGELILVNPSDRAKVRRSEVIPFSSREFEPLELFVPRERNGVEARGKLIPVDLFRDLTDNGTLEVHVRCAEGGQYFGMAQADVFLRARDGSFLSNFIKGHASIWLQMLMTISLGVMFSTFLTGPVAMLGTSASLVLGYFREFVLQVFDGVFQGPDNVKRFVRNLFGIADEAGVPGGGPIESFVRMVRQLNLTGDLELGAAQTPIEYTDVAFMLVIRLFTQMLPDLTRFDSSSYVTHGFNVDPNLLAAQVTTAFAFVMVTSIVGYFFLKTRELAA